MKTKEQSGLVRDKVVEKLKLDMFSTPRADLKSQGYFDISGSIFLDSVP